MTGHVPLRTVSLIALLAHIGCFVPADFASFSPLQHIFFRASEEDDLAASTFLSECRGISTVLSATVSGASSLVCIDELGRGTSSSDGNAIAWAVCERLLESSALTLLSTHDEDLPSELSKVYPMVATSNLLDPRALKDGSTSYGISSARDSGMPTAVVDIALSILEQLESDEGSPNEHNAEVEKTAFSLAHQLCMVRHSSGTMSDGALREEFKAIAKQAHALPQQ